MAATALSFQKGVPTGDFFPKAWASEPLTDKLKGTNHYLVPKDLKVIQVALKEAACSAS